MSKGEMKDRSRRKQLLPTGRVNVLYFDKEWELLDELSVRDATIIEAHDALGTWLRYVHDMNAGVAPRLHPLQNAFSVSVEVALG